MYEQNIFHTQGSDGDFYEVPRVISPTVDSWFLNVLESENIQDGQDLTAVWLISPFMP